MKLVLDTTVFVDFLDGDEAARRVMQRVVPRSIGGDEGFVSLWTVAELLVKPNLTPSQQAQRIGLTRDLSTVEIDRSLMENAVLKAADARNDRPKALLFDAIIGATAESVGARVISRNTKDFQTLGVDCEDY